MKNLLAILLFSYTMSLANDYTVAIKFKLTSTALNRALQQQYNQPNFTTTSGSYLEFTYTLRIVDYYVNIYSDHIKIYLGIRCTTSVGNFDVVLQPTINIPSSSISTDQVKAVLIDLPNKVNELELPQWLKSVLISKYESLEPWVYPSKLLKEINNSTLFIRQRNVDVQNLTLGFQVLNNELILTVTASVNASKPDFKVSAFRGNQNGVDYNIFSVDPNINVDIKKIELFSLGGNLIWNSESTFTCEKDQYKDIDMGEISDFSNGHTYIAKVLYKIHETFYYREYRYVHYSIYSGATYFLNN